MMKTLILAAMLAASSSALADTYKDFNYTTPDGWGAYPGRCRGVCLLGEATKGRIDIYTIGAASAQAATKTVVGNPAKQQSISIDKRAGWFAMGNGKAVAATAAGDQYLLFVLEVGSDAQADVGAWAGIIDGGQFSSSGTATPPPAPDYGTRQPKQYTIKFANVGTGCSTKFSWDGVEMELGPGGTRTYETSEGTHEFSWTASKDGTRKSDRFSVPQDGLFNSGCVTPQAQVQVPPPKPQPQPQPQPQAQPQPQPTEDADLATLESWARLVVGKKYRWTQTSSGTLSVSMGVVVSIWATGDDNCPMAFQYLGVASGVARIEETVNGCAFITNTVPNAPAGRTWWRFVATYADLPAHKVKGPVNTVMWEGAMHIYTNAIAFLNPYGDVFGLAGFKDKWVQLNMYE